MSAASPSVESLVRLLIWVGGVAATVVGSWASSKIHVYQESRKAHLEDIKQKVFSFLSVMDLPNNMECWSLIVLRS